jgi:hypothetical protein
LSGDLKNGIKLSKETLNLLERKFLNNWIKSKYVF